MKSISQTIFSREIFGFTENSSDSTWELLHKISNSSVTALPISWIQARDNILACVNEKGGLSVYNTLKDNLIFHTSPSESVIKAWFYRENIMTVVKIGEEIVIYMRDIKELNETIENLDRWKEIKRISLSGIHEIDISKDLFIVKYENYFIVYELFGGDSIVKYKGSARYTKGFIISISNGEIILVNIKNGLSYSFIPNFLSIFHIDVIERTVLAYNESAYCVFDLETRAYRVNLGRTLYKYFEIEDSNESVVLFSDSLCALLTPDEIFINGCQEIFSVCDNQSHIFILSPDKVYLVFKGSYRIQEFCIESPQALIGCNENDCEVFLVDYENITICMI